MTIDEFKASLESRTSYLSNIEEFALNSKGASAFEIRYDSGTQEYEDWPSLDVHDVRGVINEMIRKAKEDLKDILNQAGYVEI